MLSIKIAQLKCQLNKKHHWDIVIMAFLAIVIFLILKKSFSYWTLVFLVIGIIFLINKPQKIMLSFLIGLIAWVMIKWVWMEHTDLNELQGNFLVKDMTKQGLIIEHQRVNFLIKGYYSQISIGDTIKIKGFVEEISLEKIDFYLKSKHLYYQLKVIDFNLISQSHNFKYSFLKYLNQENDNYQKIISLLILGIKNRQNYNLVQQSYDLGIAHLFVISGFHLVLIFKIFNWIFKFFLDPNYALSITFIILFIYLWILNFTISAQRAFIMLLLYQINKKWLKSQYSSLDICGCSMIIIFIYKPYQIYSWGFILSFLVVITILTIQKLSFNNWWTKSFAIVISANLIALPISIYLSKKIVIFAIFNNFILSLLFPFFYLGTIMLMPFRNINNQFLSYFLIILELIKKYNLTFDYQKFSLNYVYGFYCFSLIMVIIKKAWFIFMVKKNI